jgi:RimJ/RimL family protein N-acetyltransferase/uridine phosphorylase
MTTIHLTTPRLIIRSPLLSDAAAIHAAVHASGPELAAWMPWANPLPTLAHVTTNLAEAIAGTAADNDYRLLLTTHDGAIIGSSGIHAVNWAVPRGEIGYWLDSRHAGQGYAREATAAITAYARDVMGLRRIEIIVSDGNARSWRIPEHLGYTLEGILREHRINPDGWRDHTRIYACVTPQAEGQGAWGDLHRRALAPAPVQTRPPLLRFDPSADVMLDPHRIIPRHTDMPEVCVLCFFQDALTARVSAEQGTLVRTLRCEIGQTPVYRLGSGADAVALAHPGVGAPLAVGFLEELIALGARRFIVCGGAGAIRPDLECGRIVVPDLALRDEGTSYHYLPAEVPARPGAQALAQLLQTLDAAGVPYERGTTWTTDAIYRETRERVAQHRAAGCLTVEMEAAALFAAAAHRGVELACLLYCGDLVGGEVWDGRNWHAQTDTRARLLELALRAARAMAGA